MWSWGQGTCLGTPNPLLEHSGVLCQNVLSLFPGRVQPLPQGHPPGGNLTAELYIPGHEGWSTFQ